MSRINCTVNLNSDCSGSFYTGNIVTGIIVLELHRDQKIERIDFEVAGTCKAQWTRPSPTIPYIKSYSGKTKILSVKIEDIFREVFNGNKIPAGIHRYPFHFALPEDLPSTFEGSIGKVYYQIKIKSHPTSKIKKVIPFNVTATINLNHMEELLKPSLHEFQKTLSCNSGNIEVTVRTYRAFASKQVIPFEIIISNEKKVRINKINVILLQKIRYTVSSGYADEEREMSKVEYKKFSNSIAEVCNFNINVPLIVPTSLNSSDPMIDVSYIFRILVVFPFHFTHQEDIPVTVASIPVVHYEF